ncbi:MAG TPA: putative Ig domain-containing protein [Streptosporangiaceae bacterium]|nr:putative Ig domain-containing protein [Streptosporangiaceae bacterium]
MTSITPALAAGTTLFNQPFKDNTVDGPVGSVKVPSAPSGLTNSACLTASGNSTANPLASCPAPNDAQGSGTLRLTPDSGTTLGGVFGAATVPTAQGIDATFTTFQYGTATPAGGDGIAFLLAATDPSNPSAPTVLGLNGGTLGYSATTATNPDTSGVADGYLGIALDAAGSFSNKNNEGTGCQHSSGIAKTMPGQVVIRGPGNGTVGYCPVQSTARTPSSPSLTLTASTRTASTIPVEVVINPTSSTLTTASGLSVPAGDYDVTFTPIGGTSTSLVHALPTVPSGLYPSSWLNSSGIPKQLAFGWAGSTSSLLDFHEVGNALVTSLNPVPILAISQTSYTVASPAAGSPITYVINGSSSGPTENQPVTITETGPAGALPVSAYGTGWTCAAPVGQQISCTSTGGTFTSGTITVNAVATGSTLTSATVASGTTATISSSDGSPASATATAGTLPTTPTVTSISPTNGAAGGGNSATITGTNLGGATAVEIGTTAEFNAGTPTTLVLCSSPAAGCFTITNSTAIAISSMPAHASGAVTVKVVSLGVSGSISYTYNPGPALLFPPPPGGEVSVGYSNTFTVTGGTSPYNWSISSGSLPPGLSLNSSTGTVSGTQTTAGTFSFTVKVTDSSGLSATKDTSITIVPAPSLTFGTLPQAFTNTFYSVTLSASGGVTPYVFSLSGGSLPAGLSLAPDGVISGTPTTTGTSSFTVKLVDANGVSTTNATSITVAAGVTTNFAPPPSGVVGLAYSYTLTATGGTTPYTWAVDSGTLPPGITLGSGGVLSGTPTTAGSSTFVVSVSDANGGVATASITLVVTTAPVLTINSTASTSTTTPGSTVTYTITATNAGGVSISGATFTDSLSGVLDDATFNNDAATTSGSLSYTSPNLTWTGNLAIGAVATITFSVTVKNPDTGDKTMTSALTSTTTGSNCPSGNTDSRCSNTVTVLVPGLAISLTASSGTATPGSAVSYTVTATNAGQTAYAGTSIAVSLATALDDADYNGDGTATSGTVNFASPNLTWTGNLAVGATVTITFSMTVKNPDTGDKNVVTSVSSAAAGSNCMPGSTDSRCSNTVKVLVPGLTIAASAGVSTTTPGATVSYTITVTDSGDTAYTGATMTDALSAVLDDATYNGDASATSGTATFTSPNLTWTGNLAVGASATITFSVTVKDPDAGNAILASTITSTTAGSNCASGSTDPQCSVSVPVAILTIVNTADAPSTTPGSVVRFTATFTNAGQVPYTGITLSDNISDVVDDAAPNGDQTATSGTLILTATGIAWTGSIPIGGTVTVTGTVTVFDPGTGNKLLAARIVTTAAGSNCPSGSTDPRCSVSVPVLVPGLTITQAADTSAAVPGQKVTYTETITNAGQTAYTGISVADDFSQSLDESVYNNDASAAAGGLSYAAGVLTWTGNLAVGASAVVTFSLTVNNPVTGDKTLVSSVSSAATGSNCPVTGAPASCTLTVAILTPGLTIVKTADVEAANPGQVVHYTITVTNSGQTPYPAATFTDDLSGLLDDAAYGNDASATSGTVGFTSPNLTWTGTLAVGASATITYTVQVDNPDTGEDILTNTVTSSSSGSNCPASSTDPRCSATVTVVNPSSLTYSIDADNLSAAPGQVVTYTIKATNSGLSAISGASVSNDLTGLLDDATYNGDASATSGTVSFTTPNLTWTGNIPASSTVTITYTVTVDDPPAGDEILTNTLTSTNSGNNCFAGNIDPRCAETVTVAQLVITNASDVSTTTPGSVIRFTATFTNAGQTDYTGITISEDLSDVVDDATGNGDQTATSGTLILTDTGIDWTGDIPVGGTVTVTGTLTVNDPDIGNKLIAGTITTDAQGSNCPSGTTAPSCSVSIAVLIPALSITQHASAVAAVPGQTVTFTVTIANAGQTDYTGISVSDDIDESFDDAAYNNDAAVTTGSVSFAGGNVTWTGDLAVGATAVLTYSMTVNDPDNGDKQLHSVLNSAAVGSTCPPTGADCSLTVPILTPLLTSVVTANPADTVAGSTITYTITITDSGQTPYTGASVTDALPDVLDDSVFNNDASATSGTVSFTSPNLTWTGNLSPGGSATATFTVTVNSPLANDYKMVSVLTSTTSGTNCASGSTDPRCTNTVLISGMLITNVPAASTTSPGNTVNYTITVTDVGLTTYTDTEVDDDLTGLLDDANFNNDAVATAGSVEFDSPVLEWHGSLSPGDSVTMTFSVTVKDPQTGDQVMTSTTTSGATGASCPVSATPASCTATVAVLTPQLTITKTADSASATPGSTVGFTIRIANTGQTTYNGATVTDDLRGVLDDAAYNGDANATIGALSFASPTLTWTGSLAPGATTVVTYSATVNNPDLGQNSLDNTVASTAIGSTCPPGSTSPACAVTVPVLTPGLTITKTADVATANPGDDVSYRITITDSGQTAYSPATVTDNLSGLLDDATYNNDATASVGTFSYSTPLLTWTGDLSPGETTRITYTTTVNDPDNGTRVMDNTVASTDPGSTCPPDSTESGCSVSVSVVAGSLSISVPGTASLGSAAPGTTVSGSLGTVQVIDNRGFGADWTATVSSTAFTTGTGTGPQLIPPTDVDYLIPSLFQTTGRATFSFVPSLDVNVNPQAVVSATNVNGDTSATWTPNLDVHIPAGAVAGNYTAVVTHSVS